MFRFTVRELVLLTTIVGLAVALVLQQRSATLWRLRAGSAAAAVDYAGWGLTWKGANAVNQAH